MANILQRFRKNTSGASMVEYALLVALIALVAMGAFQTLGTNINTRMGTAATTIGGGGGGG
jgi:pilus assembly protein Flp/PilA